MATPLQKMPYVYGRSLAQLTVLEFRTAPLAGGYVREKTRQPRDLEVPVRVSAGHGQERVQVSDDPSLSCDDETIYFENDPIACSISSRSKSGRGKKKKKERKKDMIKIGAGK